MRLFWIMLGGAIGTGARYFIGLGAPGVFGLRFPWPTLIVNVAGSFLLGAIMQFGATSHWMSPTLRLALSTGVMGGFTTYSAFNYETLNFLRQEVWMLAVVYITATIVLSLGAGAAGVLLAKSLAS